MKHAGTYAGYLHSEIMRVVPVYVILGLVVILLAAAISYVKFPAFMTVSETGTGGDSGRFRALLGYPHFLLAVLAQFAYVGRRLAPGLISSRISKLTRRSRKRTQDACSLSAWLHSLRDGSSTPLMRFVSPARLTGIYAIANVILLLGGILRPGLSGGYFVMATSFFMSVMFPTIFALGIKGLGPNTKLGGSFIVMAVVGGAVIPLLMGLIKDRTGQLALGFLVPLAGYVIVALYGLTARMGPESHEVNLSPEVL